MCVCIYIYIYIYYISLYLSLYIYIYIYIHITFPADLHWNLRWQSPMDCSPLRVPARSLFSLGQPVSQRSVLPAFCGLRCGHIGNAVTLWRAVFFGVLMLFLYLFVSPV